MHEQLCVSQQSWVQLTHPPITNLKFLRNTRKWLSWHNFPPQSRIQLLTNIWLWLQLLWWEVWILYGTSGGCLIALSDNYSAGNKVWCALWRGDLGCTPPPRALSINIFSSLIHFKEHRMSWNRWWCLVPFVPAQIPDLLLVSCHSEESSVLQARLGSAPALRKGHPCLFQGHLTG